jgi:CNT family concentrative nucleoside transporter
LGLHHDDMNWVVPFLLWLAITLRLLFFHIPISIVSKPMHWAWNNTGPRIVSFIPERFRLLAGATLTVAVIMIGAFVSEESADTREIALSVCSGWVCQSSACGSPRGIARL